MSREYEDIKVEKNDGALGGETYTHPAFGMLGFRRVSGGNKVLFGSSINHNDRIMMTLKHAKENRSLSSDWYSAKGIVAEIEMSYSQFAECITAMNVGDGVPCTIRFTERDGNIPMIAENNSKREQFVGEFSDTVKKAMSQVQKQIDSIQASIDGKKNLGIKDRQEIVKQLTYVKYNIGCNLDFCAEQFNEQMDKTVCEAKGEIEAFCQNKINSIAQAALVEHKEDFVKLENPIDLSEKM